MTSEAVQQAVKDLEARSEVVSARNVRKRLGGGSFRDLLPLLRMQALPTEAEQAVRDILAMAHACEDAITDGTSRTTRQRLIAESETLWQTCMPALLRASARGEETTAFVDVFERLREARSAVIVRTSLSITS